MKKFISAVSFLRSLNSSLIIIWLQLENYNAWDKLRRSLKASNYISEGLIARSGGSEVHFFELADYANREIILLIDVVIVGKKIDFTISCTQPSQYIMNIIL